MKKSNFCSDHFALNCSLCSGDPEPVQLAPVITSEGQSPEVVKLPESTGQPIIFQPVINQSEEAKAVLSVTDEYAKACNEYAAAIEAVRSIEDHIDRLQNMKLTLQSDLVVKKTHKEELRKKVLETLNETET